MMDLLGYAALGGLERVAIVAGAVIIGYWGYRLYVGEKNAGLVFMALAVVILVGALATGSSYVRSIGEGYQLASNADREIPATPVVPVVPEVPAVAPEPVAAVEPAPTPIREPAPDVVSEPVVEPAPVVTAVVAAVGVAGAAPEIEEIEEITEAESSARLATGQELGGRIVSVKSENVSLEWSSDSD